MNKLIFVLSLFVVISISIFAYVKLYLPPQVHAEDYRVVPVIIIPKDSADIDPNILTGYKQGALNGLKNVQSLYVKLLNGKTFQIDENVQVIYSSETLEDKYGQAKNTLDAFNFLKIDPKYFSETKTKKYAIWILGTHSLNPSAYLPGPFAVDNEEDLYYLSFQSPGLVVQNNVMIAIAHELGHAFGIITDGYALGHTCSDISPQACKPETPQPFPGAEAHQDIMQPGADFSRDYSNPIFSNSTYNPEVQVLYKSPFLNPQNDPVPSPQETQPVDKRFVYDTSINPTPLQKGRQASLIVTKVGDNVATNFGDSIGKIEFYKKPTQNGSPESSVPIDTTQTFDSSNFVISTWENDFIKFIVPDSLSSDITDSFWLAKVTTADNRVIYLWQPVQFAVPKNQVVIAASGTLTCGSEKTPLVNNPVDLWQFINGSPNSQSIYTRVITDGAGSYVMFYTVDNVVLGQGFAVVPNQYVLSQAFLKYGSHEVNADDLDQNKNTFFPYIRINFDYNFDTCPGSVKQSSNQDNQSSDPNQMCYPYGEVDPKTWQHQVLDCDPNENGMRIHQWSCGLTSNLTLQSDPTCSKETSCDPEGEVDRSTWDWAGYICSENHITLTTQWSCKGTIKTTSADVGCGNSSTQSCDPYGDLDPATWTNEGSVCGGAAGPGMKTTTWSCGPYQKYSYQTDDPVCNPPSNQDTSENQTPVPTPDDSSNSSDQNQSACVWDFDHSECTGCGIANNIVKNSCTGETQVSQQNVEDSACGTSQWCTSTPQALPFFGWFFR